MQSVDGSARAERPAPLFGRSEIHDATLQTLEEARRGTGQLLLLVGGAGVGKSTLLRQVEADARDRGFRTLHGRALPSDLPEPFAAIQDLLRSLKGAAPAGADKLADSPSLLSLFLAPYETDQGGAAPGLSGGGEAERLLDYLAGPPARVEESRTILNDRLSDFFLDLTKGEPVLIGLDDLQFADDSSIEFLTALAPALAGSRIAVVATLVPPSEAPPRTQPLLEALLALPLATRLSVRPMTEPEVAQYARWLLKGRDPGREAIMRWYTQTEGNPLFVEHVVRGSVGLVSPLANSPDAARQDLDTILRSRVRALPEPDRRALVYATVLGKEFDFPTLAVAAGTPDEERLAESVDRLVHRRLFREKGGEVYEFVSERIRAEAYAQLTETRRRILHRKVARALEARGRGQPSAIFELARQFYLAREDAPAIEYNRMAAELAGRTFAHETAMVHLERALECARHAPGADPAVELHLRIELGRVLDENEEFKRSEEVLEAAVAQARAHPSLAPQLALALLWLARTASDLGQFPKALELGREAYRILERSGNRRGLMVAHRVLGIAYWRNGDLVEAETHQREERALAEGEQDPWELGHALIDLANTLVSQGPSRLDEALALYDRASTLFSDSRDYTAQARVWMNLALVYHHRGQMDRGTECLEKAIAAAERSRSHIWIGYTRLNHAQFSVELGHPAEARESLAKAKAVLGPLGDQYAGQQLLMIEGMIRAAERDFAGAEAVFQEAIRVARELHFEAEIAETELRRAELAVARGDPAQAREALARAQATGLYTLRAELIPRAERLRQELEPGAPPTAPETSSAAAP